MERESQEPNKEVQVVTTLPEKAIITEMSENPVDPDVIDENFQKSNYVEEDIGVAEDQFDHWSDENMNDSSGGDHGFDFDNEAGGESTSMKGLASYPADGKRYQCEYCVERFKLKILMLLHKKEEHNEPIPDRRANWKLKCDICDRKFKAETPRMMHMMDMHQAVFEGITRSSLRRPYVRSEICTYCGERFTRERVLQTHIRKKHNISRKEQIAMKKAKIQSLRMKH